MANIIELFNPNDKPFGRLSNNAYHPMVINEKKYDTVTNYIYSSMLTTHMFRVIVQNTKIVVVKGVNTELIEAIDFLINPPDGLDVSSSSETKSDFLKRLVSVVESKYGTPVGFVPRDKTDTRSGQIFSKRIRKIKVRYVSRVIGKPFSKYDKLSDTKLNIIYKKTKEKVESGILIDPQQDKPKEDDEEAIEQAWIDLAKTGRPKEEEVLSEKRLKYQTMISNKVRQPFNSVNLVQLKQQLIADSTRNQMDIYQVYKDSKDKELYNTISESINKGYEARLKDPVLKKILLETGNFPIQYESADPYLGIGADGRGVNIVGKVLMQLRHNFRIQTNVEQKQASEQSKYNDIYDTYLAYMILRKEMFTNKNQLKEYLGMDPRQIIAKYGIGNLIEGVPTQETVIQLYKHDNLNPVIMKEIYQPGTMVINVRKSGIRQLRDDLERSKSDIIFNSYLEYMIKKNFEDEIEKEVDRQFTKNIKTGLSKSNKNKKRNNIIEGILASQKAAIPPEELNKLRDRVIDLFKLGMLSASLSDIIDDNISKLEIPTEEDITEAEIAELSPVFIEDIPKADDVSSTPSSRSSEGSPTTKIMKKIFKKDKLKRNELIDIINQKKGDDRSDDYKDWSTKDLRQRLDGLELEQWNGMKEEKEEYKEKGFLFVQPFGEPIGIFREEEKNLPELKPFNPEFYTGMLKIDNFLYPTMQHYMIARLIASTGTRRNIDAHGVVTFEKGMGISSGRKTILVDQNVDNNSPGDFLTIHLAGEKYDTIDKETTTEMLSICTVTALNKKFADRSLQDLLILTGDSEIRWNSPENFFLGAGNDEYPGKNYVGITMMDIREKLKVTRSTEEEIDIEIDDLINFVNKDAFIMAWVQMRLQDMCSVVYKLQQYLKKKDGINIDLNEPELFSKLIKFTLDIVYQPCSSLVELSKKVETEAPSFFINMVKKCKGLNSGVQPLTITDNSGYVRYNTEIEEKRVENERQINELETNFWGLSKIEHTIEESKEFNKHQREEWSDFMINIVSSDSTEEKKTEMDNFKQNQEEEYNEFWGIKKDLKSNDEISRNKHEISELRKEFAEYLRKAGRVDKHYYITMKTMAQIYWDHIAVMLSALIQNVQPATASNIRDVLVKVEMLNSEKTNCARIINNEQDNCIVSALLNLLIGIQKFKEEFSGNIELDSDDVELAGSIIINTKFEAKHINPDEPDSDAEDDDKFDVGSEGAFPDDDAHDSEKEEGDYGDGGDDEEDGNYGKNPYFSFKRGVKGRKLIGGRGGKQLGSTGDLAKIEQQLLLMGVSESKELSMEIMKTVQKIKNSNISPNVKQNRINFFATIR